LGREGIEGGIGEVSEREELPEAENLREFLVQDWTNGIVRSVAQPLVGVRVGGEEVAQGLYYRFTRQYLVEVPSH
jgi:hypothetical protein